MYILTKLPKIHLKRTTNFILNRISGYLSFKNLGVFIRTTLPPINFHHCTKYLLWRGNGTHKRPHTYPIQWHTSSKCVYNNNFSRTTTQFRFYVHPKTVSFLILFQKNYHFCTLYSISVNPRYWGSYVFWGVYLTGHTSHAELNYND